MAKAVYVGVKSKPITVVNLFPAISGNTGFDGGTASTAHTKYASSSLLLTGTTSLGEVTAVSTGQYSLIQGHTYYACVEVYQESVVGSTSLYWPIAEPVFYSSKTAVAGQWTRVGAVNTRSEFTTSNAYEFRLDFDNGSQAGNMWFDGLMLIDLTAAFGAGNEPDVTWCDANIPYFTGISKVEQAVSSPVARNVNHIYVGVDGVARRVRKGYVGVDGVARCFWSDGELAYYGTTASTLRSKRSNAAATCNGPYAIFAGGNNDASNAVRVTEAYDATLVRFSPDYLELTRDSLAAASIGGIALFAGGWCSDGALATVETFNSSLSRSMATALHDAKYSVAATSIENYALFAGGSRDGSETQYVEAYDAGLTKTSIAEGLTSAAWDLGATSVGNRAFFGGGYDGSAKLSTVHVYNSDLTRLSAEDLSAARHSLAATSVGGYALFGSGTNSKVVDAYQASSLTKVSVAEDLYIRDSHCATTVGDCALFAGGGTQVDHVSCYDASLTRTDAATALSCPRHSIAATTIGNYALFGGGYGWVADEDNYYSSNAVDVYTA